MSFRQFVLVTHRWLGLSSSLVLAIVGITGTLLVWPESVPAAVFIEELHQDLGLGSAGWFVVLFFTLAGIVLQAGGLVLWWKTKRLRIRGDAGLWRWSYDVHGTAGVVAFVVMLVLGASALGRVVGRQTPAGVPSERVKHVIARLHTTAGFPLPVKMLYAVCSLGFAVQGATGIIVWLKPQRGSAASEVP